VFDGTLVKLIKFPAEHLTIFHGILVFRGTTVENHCAIQLIKEAVNKFLFFYPKEAVNKFLFFYPWFAADQSLSNEKFNQPTGFLKRFHRLKAPKMTPFWRDDEMLGGRQLASAQQNKHLLSVDFSLRVHWSSATFLPAVRSYQGPKVTKQVESFRLRKVYFTDASRISNVACVFNKPICEPWMIFHVDCVPEGVF